jgi:hypothetical protein
MKPIELSLKKMKLRSGRRRRAGVDLVGKAKRGWRRVGLGWR